MPLSRTDGSSRSRSQPVGIEKIWAYPGTQSLEMENLAVARGHDPAVNPLCEDPVTMAVNAALSMLDD